MARLLLRGRPLHQGEIEAVLFDKDGTLCHSELRLLALARARVNQCQRLLEQRHPQLALSVAAELAPRLEATYGLQANGLHPAGTTAVASREHNLISTATALAQLGLGWPEALELAEAVFQHCDRTADDDHAPGATATDGVHELLQRLCEADVACAVISNDDQQGIAAFLASHNLGSYFAALRSADHHPRKPDPAAVVALCGDLGTEPGRCALIGDANSDLLMAERAGVAVVLGYSAGWKLPPPLEGRFTQLAHWHELEVGSSG
ncbi:MAG: HAD family hydrolase [Cyanobium sp. PLM2.Bin73]|nr:MAG: HAD family hydrolase [Cyanobium sp. PLM2.Bin73]